MYMVFFCSLGIVVFRFKFYLLNPFTDWTSLNSVRDSIHQSFAWLKIRSLIVQKYASWPLLDLAHIVRLAMLGL
jgi:hypothetical protein